jgi:hypothetical protein
VRWERAVTAPIETDTYCRELEAYLCRKNDGHLVRIVGPAFEQVCGWAARGVPLGVAQRGIDRYFERYYAKGPRRRPVRIEFCEADVLDAFDEWRRALGIPLASGGASMAREQPDGDPGDVSPVPPKESLPAHLERAIARLTVARASAETWLDAAIDAVIRELETMRSTAKGLRGPAREAVVDRLAALDRQLLDLVRERSGDATLGQVTREADSELAPFRDRMLTEAYAKAREACIDRLLRERARLPVLTLV